MNAQASQLRKNTTAVRIHFNWFGTKKTLTNSQKAKAAETFGASKDYLSASQKILDTNHPAFRAVTAIKTQITDYWRGNTLPYVEAGVRLLSKSKVAEFDQVLKGFREAFNNALQALDDVLYELKNQAQLKLGTLYRDENYPPSIKEEFDFTWDFPSIEPPDYLMKLAPDVYEKEKAAIEARLSEAVTMAETAFMEEFQKLVQHLAERLEPGQDNQKKVFRDSTIDNLLDFFKRFKELHLGGSEQLESLVGQAEDILKGFTPKELRDNKALRQDIAKDLATVKEKLNTLVVNAPRRQIIRIKENGNASQATASQPTPTSAASPQAAAG